MINIYGPIRSGYKLVLTTGVVLERNNINVLFLGFEVRFGGYVFINGNLTTKLGINITNEFTTMYLDVLGYRMFKKTIGY